MLEEWFKKILIPLPWVVTKKKNFMNTRVSLSGQTSA